MIAKYRLKPGQLWRDLDTETQQTRATVHKYIEWWMDEAREHYYRLQQAQQLLHNPIFKRAHAVEQIKLAMRRCQNANNEAQYNMRALSRLNAPKVG